MHGGSERCGWTDKRTGGQRIDGWKDRQTRRDSVSGERGREGGGGVSEAAGRATALNTNEPRRFLSVYLRPVRNDGGREEAGVVGKKESRGGSRKGEEKRRGGRRISSGN